ncbi:Egl nine -like protein 1 [Triplophysa tibetana]|uniref:Egl nine-like protein 1 n=1 Tax=Triplophysa tibetana TaxID=1572043 RepID=A0A5A9NFE2_9TELE|nr:Egl nine -like protein 1 [Triplophysa tibetana]
MPIMVQCNEQQVRMREWLTCAELRRKGTVGAMRFHQDPRFEPIPRKCQNIDAMEITSEHSKQCSTSESNSAAVTSAGESERDFIKSATGSDTPSDAKSDTSKPNGQTRSSPQKLALDYIVPCMNKHGICVVDNFLGDEIGSSILEDVRGLYLTGGFTDGQLVSQRSDSSKDIRGDKITWVEGKEPGCERIAFLMSRMDDLIRHCNGKLDNYKINGRTKELPVEPQPMLLIVPLSYPQQAWLSCNSRSGQPAAVRRTRRL